MSPTILFEDENVLAIDKPAGLLVHEDGRSEEQTLSDWLLEKYPEIKGVGEPWERDDGSVIERPGIVHRLDRETSGVMLVAKTQEAFEHLKEQFQERTIKKIYNTFVYGNLKEKEGVIDRQIGKSRNFKLWSAQRGARGELRDAITEYTVLKEMEDASFIEVRPKTGRTHQIRVHMKAVHHPVICDKLYAPKLPCMFDFERLALHALAITFTMLDGEEKTIEAPLPEDFQIALQSISK